MHLLYLETKVVNSHRFKKESDNSYVSITLLRNSIKILEMSEKHKFAMTRFLFNPNYMYKHKLFYQLSHKKHEDDVNNTPIYYQILDHIVKN